MSRYVVCPQYDELAATRPECSPVEGAEYWVACTDEEAERWVVVDTTRDADDPEAVCGVMARASGADALRDALRHVEAHGGELYMLERVEGRAYVIGAKRAVAWFEVAKRQVETLGGEATLSAWAGSQWVPLFRT